MKTEEELQKPPFVVNLLLTSLILFSSVSISYAALQSSDAVLNAVEVLSDSGFLSMALTLQLVSQTIIPQGSSATIFSPSDAAFARSGQPSFPLLQYHCSPLRSSVEDLRALRFGSKIPTLLANHSLIVTTQDSDRQLSINNVKINGSLIYDDGSLAIYGIDEFFDPSFQFYEIPAPEPSPSSPIGCLNPFLHDPSAYGTGSFAAATDLLKSRGYSKMAWFLDMQLLPFTDQTTMTVFAPVDQAIEERSGNFSEYSVIFRRHVLPCRVAWGDMVKFEDGTILQTLSEGFTINVTRSGNVLVINEVPIIFPDMYYSDSLIVHGLRQLPTLPENQEPTEDSFSEFARNDEDNNVLDYGEFGGP